MNGEKKRARLDQRRAPIHEALENFRQMRVVPFDVPGHKRGRGNPEPVSYTHLDVYKRQTLPGSKASTASAN